MTTEIIDLAKVKKEKEKEELELEGKEVPEDFEAIMKKNAEKKAKLAKERATANRGVIRSYRLKK